MQINIIKCIMQISCIFIISVNSTISNALHEQLYFRCELSWKVVNFNFLQFFLESVNGFGPHMVKPKQTQFKTSLIFSLFLENKLTKESPLKMKKKNKMENYKRFPFTNTKEEHSNQIRGLSGEWQGGRYCVEEGTGGQKWQHQPVTLSWQIRSHEVFCGVKLGRISEPYLWGNFQVGGQGPLIKGIWQGDRERTLCWQTASFTA